MIYTAPEKRGADRRVCIFLGGTIDMGASRDWQAEFTEKLVSRFGDLIDIYNPRRKDWDSSWEQTKENPYFSEQVNWELDALEDSHIIIMNLLVGSASPISFLELGLYGNNCIVCCPKGFYRKGNVDIVCQREEIDVYETEDQLLDKVYRVIEMMSDVV